MTVYTTLPTDDANLAVTVTEANDLVKINITPASVNVTSAVTSVNGATGNVTLTTDNISEGSNLYYTDGRFDTRLAAKTTADLTEGSNLYYTDARARAAISESSTQLAYNSSTGVLTYTQGDTDTVSEGSSNLYYTNARVDSHLNQSNPTAGYVLSWSGSDYAWISNTGYTNFNTDFDTRLATKDTANLTEGTNLYYTDARARASISATGSISYNSSTGVISYTQPTTVSTFSNDAGYITASSSDTLTNKSGNVSQFTNDSGYTTASSTETLTNKSGNVSMFTNDAGYLTSETDSQTLSFSSPNLTISNGNSVDISAIADSIDGGTY